MVEHVLRVAAFSELQERGVASWLNTYYVLLPLVNCRKEAWLHDRTRTK